MWPRAATRCGGKKCPRRAPLTAWGWTRRVLGLLSVLVPILSMFVLLHLLIVCNMHLMYGAVAEGVLEKEHQRDLATAQKPAIFMHGLLLFGMMLVPVLNLLVPALLCTSLCHLRRRGWTGRPEPAERHASPPSVARTESVDAVD